MAEKIKDEITKEHALKHVDTVDKSVPKIESKTSLTISKSFFKEALLHSFGSEF